VPNKVWEVYVYGDVPQCMEITAPTREAAINRAFSEIFNRLEMQAEVKTGEGNCETPSTPVGEQKAKSRPGSGPTPAGEGKEKK
jgi:hypothetical protein